MRNRMKYIFVTGGVVSGLGKGITASSIGVLLRSAGLRVTAIKIDPYLNTDAGTMSPFEHGEVFVLDDGGEADLDLGNYERFMDITLGKDNNLTTGKIYQHVIERERKGEYLGKTVQVVPHITDAIQDWIERVAHTSPDGKDGPPDVCIVELGGTVGDIESMPFVEALRQFQFRVGADNVCFVHVSLVPVLGVVGEQKTKPTQHSVQTLRSLGLSPNMLACRSSEPLEGSVREKMALFCQVPPSHILSLHDVSNIWHVPLIMQQQGADTAISKQLDLPLRPLDLVDWRRRALHWDSLTQEVHIAMVGKYTGLSDSYLSVIKALTHAAIAVHRKLVIRWIEASMLEPEAELEDKDKYDEAWNALHSCDGVLVPGGFGNRGVEGKILAANFARVHRKPYLGVCLGMQVAVIEFARNVLKLEGAHSTEFEPATPHPVIVFMPEVSKTHLGGTMRLGARTTMLQTVDCISAKLYRKETHINERHRHRYEVNPELVDHFEKVGLHFVGKDETGKRMEILEVDGHPFFLATQYHPEFKSRPGSPSPVFLGLLLASTGNLDTYMQGTSERTNATEQLCAQ